MTRVRGYVTSPWFQIGAAAAAGFLLGRRSFRREPDIPVVISPEPEAIVHTIVRAALVTLTTSAIRRVILGRVTDEVGNGDRVRL